MPWQPIQDLPEDWRKLANPELPPLVTVWKEQAERLRNSGEHLKNVLALGSKK